jgi:phage/plasmid-associated DNA primase
MESEIWEKILEDTSQKIKWKFTIKDKDRRIFAPKDGYFEELSKEETKLEIRGIFKSARPATVASLVDALLEDPDRRLDENLFLKSRERVIGFLNGVFDLHHGKRRSYNPHDFILDPLPYHLPDEVDAKIEKWFVDDILTSWVGKDTADWFCNLLAYCLFIFPNGEQKWFNFFGMGANGKSVCLKVLEKACNILTAFRRKPIKASGW